jgi:hypothetical protein
LIIKGDEEKGLKIEIMPKTEMNPLVSILLVSDFVKIKNKISDKIWDCLNDDGSH